MTDLAKLVVKLEAQSSQLTAELQRAKRQVQRFDKDVVNLAKKIGTGIGVAIAGAATGLGVMVKNSIDAADELSKLSQKVGIATDDLSKLNYAAKLADVETEALGAALAKLSKAAVDPTKEQVAAFKALGVSLKDAQGNLKSTDELLKALADGFSRFADGPEKTAAALAILGKSGAQLIPLLNGGSQAIKEAGDQLERFGGVVTPEAGRAAEKFNDDLTALKTAAGGVANQVATNLIGSLGDLSGKLVSAAEDGDRLKIVSDGITEAIKTMALGVVIAGEAIVGVAKAVRAVGGSFESVYADIKLFEQLTPIGRMRSLLMGETNSLKEAFDERQRVAAEANQRYVDLWNYNGTAVSDALRQSFNTQKGYVDKTKELLAGVTNLLPQAAAGGGAMIPFREGKGPETLVKPQLRYAGALEETVNSTKKAKKEQSEYDAILELHKKMADEDAERQEALNEKMREAAEIVEANLSPLERYNAQITKLNELRDIYVNGKPLIDPVSYERSVQAARDQFSGLESTTKEVTDKMSVYADEAARNMQDAFADFLFDPFSKGLEGMVSGFAEAMRRFAAEKAAAQIFDGFSGTGPLSGLLGPIGSYVGSFFGGGSGSGAVDFANQDPFGPVKYKALALGGPVAAGSPYVVGEVGPELFVPNTSGQIVPNDELGGRRTVNLTVNLPGFQGTLSKASEMQFQAAAARALRYADVRDN